MLLPSLRSLGSFKTKGATLFGLYDLGAGYSGRCQDRRTREACWAAFPRRPFDGEGSKPSRSMRVLLQEAALLAAQVSLPEEPRDIE